MSAVLIAPLSTHRDPRGSLFEPLSAAELAGQKNVHVVLTLPDAVRGNHRHLAATETTTVVGPCRVRLKENGAVRDVQVPDGEIWRFTIPPGVAHAFHNTGGALMVLVSFSSGLHDPGGTDTVREALL